MDNFDLSYDEELVLVCYRYAKNKLPSEDLGRLVYLLGRSVNEGRPEGIIDLARVLLSSYIDNPNLEEISEIAEELEDSLNDRK